MRKQLIIRGAITRQLRLVDTSDAKLVTGAMDRAERMAIAIDAACWAHEHQSAAEECLCVLKSMLEQDQGRHV